MTIVAGLIPSIQVISDATHKVVEPPPVRFPAYSILIKKSFYILLYRHSACNLKL
jgi:hypothetical protein